MHRTSIARLAAVLSLAAAAACADTPTATPAASDSRITRPAYNLPVAQVTVTNSSGTPLVS